MEQLFIQVSLNTFLFLFIYVLFCCLLGPWFSGGYLLATTTSTSVNEMSFAELSKVAANENRKQLDFGIKAHGVGPSVGGIKQRNEEVSI